jgi:hypothetical protein
VSRLTDAEVESAALDDEFCGEFILDYTDIVAVRKLARLSCRLADELRIRRQTVPPGTTMSCSSCGSRAIEVSENGNLLDHYRPGSVGGVCRGPRGCPCDDGDGEGCPTHGIGTADDAAHDAAHGNKP